MNEKKAYEMFSRFLNFYDDHQLMKVNNDENSPNMQKPKTFKKFQMLLRIF